MNKKLFSLISVLLLVLTGCSDNTGGNSSTDEKEPSTDIVEKSHDASLTFDGFDSMQSNYSLKKVSNETKIFNFVDCVVVNELSTWKLYQDIECTKEIVSKVCTLSEGDNFKYVLVTAEDRTTTKLYSANVYRNHLYTVSFNTQDGTYIEDQKVEEGKLAKIPYNPSRTGYKFSNWDFDFDTPINSDLVVNALWDANVYKITYNHNDGANNFSYQNVVFGEKFSLLNNVTRNGYSFSYWTKDGVKFSDSIFNIPSDITLVASWKANTYSITYELDGGTVSGNPTAYTPEDNLSLKSPSKTGYTFKKWILDGTSTVVTTIGNGMYGDIKLIAVYSINSYEVNVVTSDNKMGYTLFDDEIYGMPMSLKYNSTHIATAYPQDGYRFYYWKIDKYNEDGSTTSTNVYTSSVSITITCDCDITAFFEPNIYYYTCYSKQPTYGKTEQQSSQGAPYLSNQKIKATPFDGYSFVGWYDTDDNLISDDAEYEFIMPAHDVSFYAVFKKADYKVEVIIEDDEIGRVEGSGDFASNKSVKLTAIAEEGYTFIGWSIDGIVVSINNPLEFKMPKENLKFKAIFKTNNEANADKKVWNQNHGVSPVQLENDYIAYGFYPQTKVTNQNTLDLLEKFKFLLGKEATTYFDGEYYVQYTSSSPSYTAWYQCEPIRWKIISIEGTNYQLVSTLVLDNYYFNNTQEITKRDATDYKGNNGYGVYANNYKFSSIRTWLNTTFYNEAFKLNKSYLRETEIDNSQQTTNDYENPYYCQNTYDFVSLCSYRDFCNQEFCSLCGKKCIPSDYAIAKGVSNSEQYCNYLTRSPYSYACNMISYMKYDGSLSSFTTSSYFGIRPQIFVSL